MIQPNSTSSNTSSGNDKKGFHPTLIALFSANDTEKFLADKVSDTKRRIVPVPFPANHPLT